MLVLTFTADDLARERAAGVRLLQSMGVRPGMRVANALRGALTTPGSLLFGDVVDEMGCLDVPLGFPDNDGAAAGAWKLIDRVEPQVLVVDSAGAARLFAAAPRQARPWLQGIIWSRVAGHDDTPLPCPDNVGFSGWQRSWLAVPEATSFLAADCEAAALHPDSETLVEVLAGSASSACGKGRLLLTPLGVDTPVLRYDSELNVEIVERPCRCGQTVQLIRS